MSSEITSSRTPRVAARERMRAQQHGCPSSGPRERLADATRVAQNQISLELDRLGWIDPDVLESTETRRHTVDSSVGGNGALDNFASSGMRGKARESSSTPTPWVAMRATSLMSDWFHRYERWALSAS